MDKYKIVGISWAKMNELFAELYSKVCYITDADGLQHEVVHWSDAKDVLYDFYSKEKERD